MFKISDLFKKKSIEKYEPKMPENPEILQPILPKEPVKTVINEDNTLTLKQQKFVANYIATGNGTKAAIEAGYSEKVAHVQAFENLRKPKIQERINQVTAKIEERGVVTKEYVLEGLKEVHQLALSGEKQDLANANRALENLGKSIRMFTDNVNVGGDKDNPLTIVLDKKASEV